LGAVRTDPGIAGPRLPPTRAGAGAVWEPGLRRWLVERRRIGPVIRALEAATDPLFRRVGSAWNDLHKRAGKTSPELRRRTSG